jgi:acyl-CoA synthetase (AMP-forming)/AMP-acid ligase II
MAPFPSVRILTNSGGKVSLPMLGDMERAFPAARIFLMYGLTEAFRSTYLPPEQLRHRPGSIGQAIPNAEILLIAADGRLAQAGEVGEIVHRGDTVARGYWNRQEETARVFRPHPFPTPGQAHPECVVYSGDYATRDEEGFLYYLGRRDQQLKVAGMRVSPEEIETVIASIDGVSECVVTGTAGDDNGDWIVAFVIAQGPLDVAGILRACAQRLPRHMIPREVRLCSSFPRLDNGKTDRVALRDSLCGSPKEADSVVSGVVSDQLGGGHGR